LEPLAGQVAEVPVLVAEVPVLIVGASLPSSGQQFDDGVRIAPVIREIARMETPSTILVMIWARLAAGSFFIAP
jgi:hypothetical protein